MPSLNNSQTVINSIKRRKSNLIKIFDSKCCICGFDAFQEALEFHHVDPSTKEFALASTSNMTKSIDKQIKEVRKCILVCANCHRGIEYGYLQVPENWQSLFREDIAQELLEQTNAIKNGQKRYCARCNKELLSYGSTYCPECKSFLERKAERPPREELKKLIREESFTKIASMYGVTDNAIRKWCDAENLPRKKTDIKKMTDEEWALV